MLCTILCLCVVFIHLQHVTAFRGTLGGWESASSGHKAWWLSNWIEMKILLSAACQRWKMSVRWEPPMTGVCKWTRHRLEAHVPCTQDCVCAQSTVAPGGSNCPRGAPQREQNSHSFDVWLRASDHSSESRSSAFTPEWDSRVGGNVQHETFYQNAARLPREKVITFTNRLVWCNPL